MSALKGERLPLSFHMTFLPERRYLSSLLKDTELAEGGTVEEISARTGIPTGKSSGKVKPLVQYAQGMGLLEVEQLRGTGRLRLTLTGLAQVVLREDPCLLEENTQWALHLMLCRHHGGAEAWHAVFVDAAAVLGRSFLAEDLERFLKNRFGSSRDAIGPLLRTYVDPAGFGKVAAILQDADRVLLRKVPLHPALYDTVGALLFLHWDASMPDDTQIALNELEACSGLITAAGWNLEEQSCFLSAMENGGLLRVDRQTGAPILTRLVSTDEALRLMYGRLV
ncbi:hypothetical protein [Thioalkalivibrio sp. ALJ1]|uniref:hypothetical protein n=1 Tax=Thioalkalivibrio sp. ALJ1 TaxID=1158144 RepID=UPI0012E025BD|nr:hypothetical protein [Thioalkalivibrio sp. ALJ1]